MSYFKASVISVGVLHDCRRKELKRRLALSVCGAVAGFAMPAAAVLLLGEDASAIPVIGMSAGISQTTAVFSVYLRLKKDDAMRYASYELTSPYYDFIIEGRIRQKGGKSTRGRLYFLAGMVNVITLEGSSYAHVTIPRESLSAVRFTLSGMTLVQEGGAIRLRGARMIRFIGSYFKWKKKAPAA